MSRLVHSLFLLGLGFMFAPSAHSASIRGLGILDGVGVRSSEAVGISADGSVVAGYSRGQVFLWTEAGGLQPIEGRPTPETPADAYSLSADGQTVGATEGGAILWNSTNGWRELGFLGGRGSLSVPLALSSDGSVAVGFSSLRGIQAFRWEEQTGMVGLDFLPGTTLSKAYDVSSDGSRIVGRAQPPSIFELDDGIGFVWDSQSGTTAVPGLVAGESAISATVISDDGNTILGYARTASGSTEAFRWDGAGDPQSLGRLAYGDPRPNAMSADGRIIVGTHDIGGASRYAFIWDPDRGMLSLDAYLESLGVDLGGWNLWSAKSISADGTMIVGYGENPFGELEGFIAVVPEPGSAVLFGIGLVGLGIRSRRDASTSIG